MADGHTFHDRPFLAQAREIVAGQQAAREREESLIRNGRGADVPQRYDMAAGTDRYVLTEVEDVETVRQRLERLDREQRAYRASPRGRFLRAVEALAEDHPAEAYQLRGIYDRSLSELNGPGLDTAAVGQCLRILNPMDDQLAQEASDALADLLIAEAQHKAAA